MSRLVPLAVLLLSAADLLANAVPTRRVSFEHEVKLAKATTGHAYFTLRTDQKGARLEPLRVSADEWTPLPNRVPDDKASEVEVYCVPVAEVKRYATSAALLDAIRAGKAKSSSRSFGAIRTEGVFGGVVPRDRRVRAVLSVDESGKLTDTRTDIEEAPAPRRQSRLMLLGMFAAFAMVAGGVWLARRK